MVKKNPPGCFHWKYCHALLPQGGFIRLTKTWICLRWWCSLSTMVNHQFREYVWNFFQVFSQQIPEKTLAFETYNIFVFLHQTAHMQLHSGCWRRGFPRICVPFAPYRMVVPHAICPEEPRIVTGRFMFIWLCRSCRPLSSIHKALLDLYPLVVNDYDFQRSPIRFMPRAEHPEITCNLNKVARICEMISGCFFDKRWATWFEGVLDFLLDSLAWWMCSSNLISLHSFIPSSDLGGSPI